MWVFCNLLGRSSCPSCLLNEIPLCSAVGQIGLELAYFDNLLISLLVSTPTQSRPLSLAARNIFLKCKCDLATSLLCFTFFSVAPVVGWIKSQLAPGNLCSLLPSILPCEETLATSAGHGVYCPTQLCRIPYPDPFSPTWDILGLFGGLLHH